MDCELYTPFHIPTQIHDSGCKLIPEQYRPHPLFVKKWRPLRRTLWKKRLTLQS